MFSTSGYFKGLTCPYFASGLCERPYCHFRHVKPASDDRSDDGASNSVDVGPSRPSLLNMVGDAIKQVQRDIEKDKARLTGLPIQPAAVYNPTPLSRCTTLPKPPSNQTASTLGKRVTIPEYKPTPIKVLKQQAKQQNEKHSELEYDPATNYSTNINNAKKAPKRPSPALNESAGTSSKRLKANNEAEDDSSDIEATFSDEEPEPPKKKQTETKDNNKSQIKHPDKEDVFNVKSATNKQISLKKEKVDEISIKMEPDKNKEKSNVTKSNSHKDKNIFDIVCIKSEKTGDDMPVNNKISPGSSDKRSRKDSELSKSCHSTHRSTSDKSKTRDRCSSNSKERHSSHSKERRSSHSKESKERRPSKDSKEQHSSKSESKSKEKSSSCSDKSHSKSSCHKKSEQKSPSDKSLHKSSDKMHHKSSSHKSHRKHSDSTSSQGSGSQPKQEKHKQRDDKNKVSTEDKQASKKLKRLNSANLFGADSDDDVIVMSDQEDKVVVELSSEEEVLDLEELLDEEDHDIQHTTQSPEDHYEDEVSEAVTFKKKRVAHYGAARDTAVQKRKALDLPKARPSPAEVLYNRMREMQRRAEEETKKVAAKIAAGTLQEGKVTSTSSLGSEKKRKAHLPSSSSVDDRVAPADSSTQAKTISKGEKRMAHLPAKKVLKRPIIPADHSSKVPTNIRQRYLNIFIDECVKLYQNESDAFDRAIEEEKQVYSRSSTKVVYLNVAVTTVKKLRSEAAGLSSSENLSPVAKTVPSSSPRKGNNKTPSPKKQMILTHESVLGGKRAAQSNFTVKRSGKQAVVPEKFIGAELYTRLLGHALNEEELFNNGFPRPDPEFEGSAIINVQDENEKIAARENERICSRCGKRFQVTEAGKCVSQEPCVHHWGKAFKRKVAGVWDHRYNCCQGDLSAKGCQIGQRHVHDQNKYENLSGYVKTRPSEPRADANYGVYALDCEMVYTEGGLELARVTVIDQNCEVALESKVLPDYPVVDYNTRFSGLTEEEMKGTTTSLRDIQCILLAMFNDKTILIGHSLESDFIALKLIHETVVDTSVVFPHKLGPPYKKALRTLMADYMQKIIQNDEEGHDSKEDAVSCMELMLWKVKEDAKRSLRRK